MSTPHTATPAQPGAHPTDVLAAILGRPFVELTGFTGGAPQSAGLPQSVAWIEPTGSPDDGALQVARHRRFLRTVEAFFVLVLVACCSAVAYTWAEYNTPRLSPDPTKLADFWRLERINVSSLQMTIAGQSIAFQIGDKLPNGETLLDTNPQAGSYRTDRSAVTLRTAGAPAAAASTNPSPPQAQ